MFNRSKVNTGVLLALGVMSALPAIAQDAAQRVEITGSNIRRAQSETASPIQTFTAEDIAKSGKTSVAEYLQTLTVDNAGSVPTTFGNGFAAGASGISLRGLGAQSTLVLLNGRRIAPYGLADDGQKVFTDLNVIPLEAVDRVEILLDGASAIYGSDAIAGVVNVILKQQFNGIVVKASYGQAQEGDGRNPTAAITGGWGNLQTDRFNVLVNFEATKKDEIWGRDRAGRDQVGRGDLRDYGFSAVSTGGVNGGVGAILDNNFATSAINGNVRDPATLNYFNRGQTNTAVSGFTRTFPGAACGNFTSHPQGDPGFAGGAGCLVDADQMYKQIQPSQDTLNFFTRGTALVGSNMQAYAELNLYNSKSTSSTTPSGVHNSTGYPGGPVSNAAIALGAAHPDNPYFGSAARLRYVAADVGPRVSNVESDFTRFVVGLKGQIDVWDFDTAFLTSTNKVSNSRTGYLQRDATFALLNPAGSNLVAGQTNAAAAAASNPAYAALPAGSVWRIAENAGLNSAAVYAALSPTISNDSKAQTTQIDFKASRELMQLDGGALGLALGGELRRESVRLDPTSGTDKGNIIGLGYSAYDGERDLAAVYAELLAPITKTLEGTLALRYDHYSDVGSATTPKLGLKWAPMKTLALRGTYAEGFRAPSPAENGKGGLAAFTTAADPARCALGVASACSPGNVAIITSPNPDLIPETSKSYTLGLVFDPLPGTSFSVDYWEIRRKNEINQETSAAAIAAGSVARNPSTATATPGDPGAITAVLARYINSNKTTVRGVDLDFGQTFNLQSNGRLGFGLKWTHLLEYTRVEPDGTTVDFAGSHGNCDVTNCMGTPQDRVNFVASWDVASWRWAAVVNYRGSMQNRDYKDAPDCASIYADGSDAPAGCKVGSFTTVDLTARWAVSQNFQVFGSIQNLFDAKPPLDQHTYGAVSYNPLDYSGAVGRFFSIGAKYKF